MINKKGLLSSIIIIFITGILAFFAFSKEVIHLAYLTDSKYVPYTMVSMYSAIKNKKENSIYQIHVIGQSLNEKDKQNLLKLSAKNTTITIHEAPKLNLDITHLGRFAGFDVSLQKLFIADNLKSLDKVLYLD
ncbi:MAG: hypothetical protein J6W96_06420, partial [Alphaproteobacteria bacterium]|nr:hypothetical protein [Alphaproteobacteria bacterium]